MEWQQQASQHSEHEVHVFAKKEELWLLRIQNDEIELSISQSEPQARFERVTAEKGISLSPLQLGGRTFSARLDENKLFRCSKEAYEDLERWFGHEALLRMEFRSMWLGGVLFGALQIFDSLRLFNTEGMTLWVLLTLSPELV
jgi:hypothetical protein